MHSSSKSSVSPMQLSVQGGMVKGMGYGKKRWNNTGHTRRTNAGDRTFRNGQKALQNVLNQEEGRGNSNRRTKGIYSRTGVGVVIVSGSLARDGTGALGGLCLSLQHTVPWRCVGMS